MISALLDSGDFTPEVHHLTENDLECWRALWRFASEYQQQTGRAPDMGLVRVQFPDFVFTPDVDRGWAAHRLHRESASRGLRRTVRESLTKLGDDDLDGALDQLAGIERPRTARKPPASAFDHASIEEGFIVSKIPVPYRSLQRVTGGIAPGDYWLWVGRPTQGKTFNLCLCAASAVEAGMRVGYVSLEMPSRVINKRFRRCLANAKELALLDSLDKVEVKKGVDLLRERVGGQFDVYDPSVIKGTTRTVAELLREHDLVVVDHAGLVRSSDGRRAINDWRVMGEISNDFKESVLAAGSSLLAGVQLNRAGESSSSSRTAGLDKLSGSDALGQDCDVAVIMQKISKTVRLYSSEKNREGEQVRWYGAFDPKAANFKEITHDEAMDRQATDADDPA